jgi:crotonobetainyl-CoA:carnitine CoA-transferase CaiB-like acyl-CoA transferase
MFDLLTGVRILDLTTIVLGPFATQTLGDLGADVIKIESPSGDLFRAVRPGRSRHMGAGYLNCNRNKRSLVIDLKAAAGRALMMELTGKADVLVHNMRPKAVNRLGLGYEQLKTINAGLVYCAAPGFGGDGPYADEPAYDDVIQAASGLAALNAGAEGEPRFLSTIVCDKVGGLYLVQAVLAGLVRRSRTGKGCYIETPMFESMAAFLMVEQMAGRSFRPPLGGTGYDRLLSPHRKPYRTRDGYIALLPYSTEHWQRFLRFVGRDDLVSADSVVNPLERSENIDRLYQVVSESMPARTTQDWLSILDDLDIPCSRVNRLDDLFDDPHLKAVGFFREVDHPSEGALLAPRSPFRTGDVETRPDRPAPDLGAQYAEVLEEFGIAADRICALVAAGVVGGGPEAS